MKHFFLFITFISSSVIFVINGFEREQTGYPDRFPFGYGYSQQQKPYSNYYPPFEYGYLPPQNQINQITIYPSPDDKTSLTQKNKSVFTIPQTNLSFLIDQNFINAILAGENKYPVLSFAFPNIFSSYQTSTGPLSRFNPNFLTQEQKCGLVLFQTVNNKADNTFTLTTWTQRLHNVKDEHGNLVNPVIFAQKIEAQDCDLLATWNQHTGQNFPIPVYDNHEPTIIRLEPAQEDPDVTAHRNHVQRIMQNEARTLQETYARLEKEDQERKLQKQKEEEQKALLEQAHNALQHAQYSPYSEEELTDLEYRELLQQEQKKQAELEKAQQELKRKQKEEKKAAQKAQAERDRQAAQEKKKLEQEALQKKHEEEQKQKEELDQKEKIKKEQRKLQQKRLLEKKQKEEAAKIAAAQAVQSQKQKETPVQPETQAKNHHKNNKKIIKRAPRNQKKEEYEIHLIPSNIVALSTEATEWFNKGQFQKARDLFKKIVESGESNERLSLAKIDFFQGNYKQTHDILHTMKPHSILSTSQKILEFEKLHIQIYLALTNPESFESNKFLEQIEMISTGEKDVLELLLLYHGLHPKYQGDNLCSETEPHHEKECSHKALITLYNKCQKNDLLEYHTFIARTIYTELLAKGLGIEQSKSHAKKQLKNMLKKSFYPPAALLYPQVMEDKKTEDKKTEDEEEEMEFANEQLKKCITAQIPTSKEVYIQFALAHPGFFCQNLAYASTLVLTTENLTTEKRKEYIQGIRDLLTKHKETILDKIETIKDEIVKIQINYLVQRFPKLAYELLDESPDEPTIEDTDFETDLNTIQKTINTITSDNFSLVCTQLITFMTNYKLKISIDPACIEKLRAQFVENFNHYISLAVQKKCPSELFALILAFFDDKNNKTRKYLTAIFQNNFKKQ